MKLILYQKNSSNRIILSDPQNEETMMNIEEIKKMMKPGKLCMFSTKEDFVIFKSNEIAGIMITSKDKTIKMDNPEPEVKQDNKKLNPKKKNQETELPKEINTYEDDLAITEE